MAIIIGIAGGSASGKTTFCKALMAALGEQATLLTHDQYYRSLEAGTDPSEVNWDHPDTLETSRLITDIQAYQRGETITVPDYDFSRHARRAPTEWHALPSRPILVVEGILVLQDPALRALFDRSIFVETPADIRLARRVQRDVSERGRTLDGVLAQYLATVRPMHERFVQPSATYADLRLSGMDPTKDLVDRTLSWLKALLPA